MKKIFGNSGIKKTKKPKKEKNANAQILLHIKHLFANYLQIKKFHAKKKCSAKTSKNFQIFKGIKTFRNPSRLKFELKSKFKSKLILVPKIKPNPVGA